MKRGFMLGAAAFLLGAGLFGCSNTEKGLEQDTAKNGQAVSQAADKAVDNTKDAAKDATAALEVTPKVKLAITADKDLNDTRNKINVDSKDGVVHLTGNVYSADLKTKAEEIAKKTLTDMKATDTVSNELTVSP